MATERRCLHPCMGRPPGHLLLVVDRLNTMRTRSLNSLPQNCLALTGRLLKL